MKIVEKRMDLFKLPQEYTLVHCISEDCAMGAGIARIFDMRYPKMKTELLARLKGGCLKYPESIPYYDSVTKRNVINMVTKERYFHKPTYEDFREALLDVVILCMENEIKKIGMPKIGCGLDRLRWDKVKVMIEQEFKYLDVEIVVCYL